MTSGARSGTPEMTIQTSSPVTDVLVIRLVGDFDLATSPQARQAFHAAIDEGLRALVLDLQEVQYLDSSALSAIISALRHARENHSLLAIVCANPQIRRVFEITGLTRILTIYRTREEALQALSATT